MTPAVMPSQRARASDESGAVAVVMAILLVSMVLITSYIVELGLLRSDRLVAKSVADMAASAAMSVYRPATAGSPQDACLAALRYADANLPGVDLLGAPSPAGADCESVFIDTAACADLGGAQTASYSAPPYELRITMPVPDGPLMSGSVHGVSASLLDYGAYDGTPCDRVAVSLDRDRSALVFGGFVGNDPNTIAATSVGRVGAGPQGEEYASLVVLKAHGCGTMETNGNNTLIEVQGTTIAGTYYPGIIVVDTASACTSPASGRIFEPSNGARPGIRSSDEIESNGLRLGAARVLPGNAALTIEPTVIPGTPRTRLIVDDRYNCLDPYPTGPVWSPKTYTPRLPEAERDCDTSADGAPPYPYISRMHGAYQGLTLAAALASPDWSVYPDDLSHLNAGCRNVGSTTTIFDLGPSHQTGSSSGRRWFINCEGVNPATTLQPNQLRFFGVEAIVARGTIAVGDSLTVTGSTSQGAVLYFQSGNFERSSNNSRVDLTNTFVYINSGTLAWGSSSAVPLTWRAPLGDVIKSSCETYSGTGPPPAGCFSPLALWTNSSQPHNLSGGVVLQISGTFFTPNADPFELGGGNDQTLDQAQFFSGSLKASGNSTITLMPNPDTNIPSPAQELRVLIR